MLASGTANFWTSDVWLQWKEFWLLPPLYTLSLAPLVLILGRDPLAWRLVQVLVATLTIALVHRLGSALFNRQIGTGAALLAAVYLPLVTLPVLLMTENLFIPLLLLTFIWLVEFVRLKSNWRIFAAGLVLALATLTRAVSTLFFPVVIFWLLLQVHWNWRATWRPILLFTCGTLLVFTPWAVRNYQLYQRVLFTDTMGGANLLLFYAKANPSTLAYIPNPVDRQAEATRLGINYLMTHPTELATDLVPQAQHLFRPEVAYRLSGGDDRQNDGLLDLLFDDGIFVFTIVLAIVGLVFARDAAMQWLFGLWLLYQLILLIVVYTAATRFRLPTLPLLMPWAVYGAHVLLMRRHSVRWSGRAVFAAATALVITCLIGLQYIPRLGQIAIRESILALATSVTNLEQTEWLLSQARAVDGDSSRVDFAFADLYQRTGETAKAFQLTEFAWARNRNSVEARARLGALYKATGQDDLAREIFGDDAQLMEWAWTYPQYFAPVPSRIDADGLDIGNVRWMSSAEHPNIENGTFNFRWTNRFAQMRLSPQGNSTLILHLAAPRPPSIPIPYVQVWANNELLQTLHVKRIDLSYEILLPPHIASADTVVITLVSDRWQPQEGDLPPDWRGILLDWAEITNGQSQ